MTTRVTQRSWIGRVLVKAATAALALGAGLAPGVVLTSPAQAQTETVLFTFTGGATGSAPYSGVVLDEAGNLYGTTISGGGGGLFCSGGPGGCGTVFKLGPGGKETVLHSFTGGTDGAGPYTGSRLVRDSQGNLYGATYGGGPAGNGTVFKVDATGKETVLYAFPKAYGAAGANPYDGLILDAEGNIYGTASIGGNVTAVACGGIGCGVVFKVDQAGNETVVYTFNGAPADGGGPFGNLVRDAAGNLYGTTGGGGLFDRGTVFKVTRAGKETILYNFTGGMDGGIPEGDLARDVAGNLYGTTENDGTFNQGTVFKVSPTGKETVLHSFAGGTDGQLPFAGVVRDAAGNLYGTTFLGGVNGAGTVYKVDAAGNETVLYSFTGGADGGYLFSPVILGKDGNLYGTTNAGGQGCGGFGSVPGCGVVFKITLK